MYRIIHAVWTAFLILILLFAQITIGNDINNSEREFIEENDNSDRYAYPVSYDSHYFDDLPIFYE